MNAGSTNKILFIFKLLNRQSLTFCTRSSRFKNHPQKQNESLTNSEPFIPASSRHLKLNNKKSKFNNRDRDDKDGKLSTYLSSRRHNPDTFGTLDQNWRTQQELKAFPEEEDDIVVKDFLQNSESKTSLSINQYAWIIKRFLEQKKVGQAINVLETRMLKDDKVKPDNYIYNLLIGACGKVGYTKKAFNLYKQMRDRGLKVTGHTYTGLFNACANSPYPEDALRRAQQLRAVLVERAFLMNQTLYHAMIKAFGRCGDMETAFLLVDEIVEKKIWVSDETFNFLLQACITDKNTGFRQALLVWRKMLEKRVKPCLYSFNLLLRCSRDCGMGDESSTTQVIQVLLQSNQSPTIPRLSATSEQGEGQLTVVDRSPSVPNLISPQPSMGDVMIIKSINSPEHRLMLMGGSSGVIELMKKFKVKPDIKTFTQLLDQIPSTLTAEVELLDQIKQAKVPLDCDFCNMLMRKRALRGDYENAKKTLKLLQEENLRPNLLTFGVLAMSCQSLDSARELLVDIDKLGFCPNIEILGTLVKNACYRRDCEFIIEIMKIVEKENLKPNDQFLKHLENFFRYASDVLNKHLTDNTGILSGEKFDEFCELYKVWQREMRPADPPDPWEQFSTKTLDPEDLELLNYGKAKCQMK